MTDHEEQLRAVAAALRFGSAWSYSWLGMSACPYSKRRLRKLPARIARNYLIDSVRSHLYAYFYCPGRPLPLLDQLVGIPLDPSRFVERLSAANCGRGYWDEGWHAIAD